jgi:hypothetical protein
MNPDDLITLKFHNNISLLWRKDTLERIPYFEALLKNGWAKDRKEFNMEEDPVIFAKMIRRYRKNTQLSDLNAMGDYYGIATTDLFDPKKQHINVEGYKELSYKICANDNKYIPIDLTNVGKVVSIRLEYCDMSMYITSCIKFTDNSDEFIRTDKQFSQYLIKEINKNHKFWISIEVSKRSITRHPLTIYMDIACINST